ncbi:MAG: transcriptional regulator [Clostridia bacterium]|nr:transcriptional regulator [Clostridia bacterium]
MIWKINEIIKESRLKMGLTQEKFSEGICSVETLNRIENATYGVSPSTFHALMKRAGVGYEIYPCFETDDDYNCYLHFCNAIVYINSWKIDESLAELNQIAYRNYSNNKFTFQRWLYLYSLALYRIDVNNWEIVRTMLVYALSLTNKVYDKGFNPDLFYSEIELDIIILLLRVLIEHNSDRSQINQCELIEAYVLESYFSETDKDYFLIKLYLCKSIYYLERSDIVQAAASLNKGYFLVLKTGSNSYLLDYCFLLGVANIQTVIPMTYTNAAIYYASYSGSYVSNRILYYIQKYNINNKRKIARKEPTITIRMPDLSIDASSFGDGIFDIYSDNVITYGKLIRLTRKKYRITQKQLCNGLCSVSFLSKIENDQLYPDVLLARSILERLGIPDQLLLFFSDQTTIQSVDRINILRNNICKPSGKECDSHNSDISSEQMQRLTGTTLEYTNPKYFGLVNQLLRLSIPGFNYNRITVNRYSHVEHLLLNKMLLATSNIRNSSVANTIFEQIDEYRQHGPSHMAWQSHYLPGAYVAYTISLYAKNNFDKIISLYRLYFDYQLDCSINNEGLYNFIFCQVLLEKGDLSRGISSAMYSISIELMLNHMDNVKQLISDIEKDYAIKLKEYLS